MINSISSIIRKDIKEISRHHWKQFLGIGVLIGFLLFLLNIFLGIYSYTNNFSETIQNKLGMYFYIKDIPGQESIIYKKVIELQNSLQKQGLKVMFSSKEDAIKFLEQKMPDIAGSFTKYSIDNPLPSTLYIMFKNNEQYEILKTNLIKYKDIILNIKDLNDGKDIKQQESRILNIINLTNFIRTIGITIIAFLIIIIFTFIGFLTSFLSNYFKKQIEIKILLGGHPYETAKEFSIINMLIIIIGFIFCFSLLFISRSILSLSIYQIFGIGLLDIFTQSSIIVVVLGFIIEFIIFLLFSFIFSYLYTIKISKNNSI